MDWKGWPRKKRRKTRFLFKFHEAFLNDSRDLLFCATSLLISGVSYETVLLAYLAV